MVGGVRYSPELVAKVMSMRAAGTTQIEVAKHFSIDPRTVRKIENMQTIPVRAANPEQLKSEWFGVLATRIRLAAATDDDIKTAALIQAGAALITACERGEGRDTSNERIPVQSAGAKKEA